MTGGNVTGLDNAVTPTSSDYAFTYDYDNGPRTSGPVMSARTKGNEMALGCSHRHEGVQ